MKVAVMYQVVDDYFEKGCHEDCPFCANTGDNDWYCIAFWDCTECPLIVEEVNE